MKLVAISIMSWVAGLAAYWAAGRGFWGQGISSGDLRAVMFWSALAAAVAVASAYVPAMFALRNRLRHRQAAGWLLFPLVGVALGVLPVLLVVGFWSTNIGRDLMSPEAALFYGMFAAFGAVFGCGFFVAFGRSSG